MKKKLVFFIGGLNFGGMERVIFIAEKMLREEFDTVIVTLYQTDADYHTDAALYDLDEPPVSGKLPKLLCALRRLRKTRIMKRELRPDMVISFGMYSNYMNALTKGRETILMGIRSYDWLTKPFTMLWLDRRIISCFDRVHSVSALIARDAERFWNIPAERNTVIYNPYDISLIQSMADEPIDDYQFEKGTFYLITMGRLSRQKGYSYLLAAFAQALRDFPDMKLLILGNGDERASLERLAAEYGISDRVDMPGGKSNPYRYVKHADLYVLSSLSEGFPNALVEAMCLRIPVIAANCKSGPAEILFDTPRYDIGEADYVIGDYGILSREIIDEGQDAQCAEHAFAEAIRFARRNPALTRELSEKGLRRVENDFSYQKFYEKIRAEFL